MASASSETVPFPRSLLDVFHARRSTPPIWIQTVWLNKKYFHAIHALENIPQNRKTRACPSDCRHCGHYFEGTVGGGQFTEDLIVADQGSCLDANCLIASQYRIDFVNLQYRCNTPSEVSVVMLSGWLPPLVINATTSLSSSFERSHPSFFFNNCCWNYNCNGQKTFLAGPRYRTWLFKAVHWYRDIHILRMIWCRQCFDNQDVCAGQLWIRALDIDKDCGRVRRACYAISCCHKGQSS